MAACKAESFIDSNYQWLEKRNLGKIERKNAMDTIKEFVSYSLAQGSKNAHRYYINITEMENKELLSLDLLGQKFPNLRDSLDGFALDALKMADHAVARALSEGMGKGMHYKEIYGLAKERVRMLAFAIGKIPVHSVLEKK